MGFSKNKIITKPTRLKVWEVISVFDADTYRFAARPGLHLTYDLSKQFLEIENPQVKQYLDTITESVADDKRFVYYLLASKGICVVPLTGFCCDKKGFRVTLLETDDEKRKNTWNTIAESIRAYLASA